MKKNVVISLFVYLCFIVTPLQAQTRTQWKEFLDSYCEKYFDECFDGRRYISLTISDIKKISHTKVKILGRVTYRNYIGAEDTQPYSAKITVLSNEIIVNFSKKSKNIFGSDYWEDCNKNLD